MVKNKSETQKHAMCENTNGQLLVSAPLADTGITVFE